MNALAVLLLLLVEQCVLVLGQHLLLARHFPVPALDGLGGVSIALQRGGDSVDNPVNATEALPLTSLLRLGEAPRDLPI